MASLPMVVRAAIYVLAVFVCLAAIVVVAALLHSMIGFTLPVTVIILAIIVGVIVAVMRSSRNRSQRNT